MSTLSRRTLLTTAVAGTASLLPAAMLPVIGVQLYTVRGILPEKPLETLQEIERIGYKEVEVVRGGMDKMWDSLQQTKLKPVSLHVDSALFNAGKEAELTAALSDAHGRGFQYAVYPYVPPKERHGIAGIRELAKVLNRAAQQCRESNLQLCYHNHAFEFEPLEGTTPFDVLIKETDPQLVQIELDVFWVSIAGHDPVKLLQQHKGRIPLLHVKNKAPNTPVQFTETVPKTTFREAGNGAIDMPAVLRAAKASGVKHFFVEQDQTPGDPVASLRQSYQYLVKL